MSDEVLLAVDVSGQITLPDTARRALQLKPGAQVECKVVDGAVVLRRAASGQRRVLRIAGQQGVQHQ